MGQRRIHFGHAEAHVPGFQIPEKTPPPISRAAIVAGWVVAPIVALAGFALQNVGHGVAPARVSLYWITPFAVLLLAIAAMPLLAAKWWERNYGRVAIALGAVVAAYYSFSLERGRANLAGMIGEYVSFIFLLASLFVVSGGILIRLRARATPTANSIVLLIGAVLANLFGTTGAAVLLIRPFLRMNRPRARPYHVAFFIFIVANAGGSLTPIGDPPLFLGYLKGVPFFWVFAHCWPIWLTAIGALLGAFYVIDSIVQRKKPAAQDREGLGPAVTVYGAANLLLIGLIVLGVVCFSSPWRELLMATAAFASLWITPQRLHAENHFNYAPIREVALLFLGIFATMVPALNYLSHATKSRVSPLRTPGQYYFAVGALSSVLDNAPTYLAFLTAELASIDEGPDDASRLAVLLEDPDRSRILLAISMGAVLFGACTYIGNGPNFMVKSIAEHMDVPTPGFFAYIFCFTLPVLVPMLVVIWLLFLR